jgi:hypothetical protein
MLLFYSTGVGAKDSKDAKDLKDAAGFPPPDLDEEPQLTAPGIEPELIAEIAARFR